MSLNPEMFSLARDYRELSQTALAQKMNGSITQATLSKIEKGLIKPSEELIKELAHALAFPKSFFTINEKFSALPISLHAYRKKASTSAKALVKMNAELLLKISHSHLFQSITNVDKEYDCPELTIGKTVKSAKEAARKVREIWGLGNYPIENLTDVIEKSGIYIFICDFQDSNVDGVSIKQQGSVPCIFINANQPNDRKRFTLAHELGHVVLHSSPSENMEEEANQFAAELLMPESAIKKELGSSKLVTYATLKPKWKVSMAALIYRAYALETISNAQYTALWREMAIRNYRKKEPQELDREIAFRIGCNLYEYSAYTECDRKQLIYDLSKIFCLYPMDIEELYKHDFEAYEIMKLVS